MLAGSSRLTLARDDVERLSQYVASAGIAGVLVGVPAGLLARLIMKISAIAAGPAQTGVHTENGNVVGALTAEGTLAIVVFSGVAPTVAGALLYVAVRPWLLPLGRWRGLALGAYLLAIGGLTGLDPLNFDFQRFGPAALNVAMFCGLFLVVGIALAPVADAALARLTRGNIGLLALGFLFGVLGAMALVAVAVASVVSWLTTGFVPSEDVAPALMAASAAIAVGAHFRRDSLLSYVALGIPLAFGIWLTGNAIVTLLR